MIISISASGKFSYHRFSSFLAEDEPSSLRNCHVLGGLLLSTSSFVREWHYVGLRSTFLFTRSKFAFPFGCPLLPWLGSLKFIFRAQLWSTMAWQQHVIRSTLLANLFRIKRTKSVSWKATIHPPRCRWLIVTGSLLINIFSCPQPPTCRPQSTHTPSQPGRWYCIS